MFNVQNPGTLVTSALHFLTHPSRPLNLKCTLGTPSPPFPDAPVSAPGSSPPHITP